MGHLVLMSYEHRSKSEGRLFLCKRNRKKKGKTESQEASTGRMLLSTHKYWDLLAAMQTISKATNEKEETVTNALNPSSLSTALKSHPYL